jgi:hypothetical protein
VSSAIYQLAKMLRHQPPRLSSRLKAALINAGTAPSFETAQMVNTISGEFVMKIETKSPLLIPRWYRMMAKRSTSKSMDLAP